MAVPVSSLFTLKFAECKHMPAKNKLTVLEHRRTLIEVFEEEHGGGSQNSAPLKLSVF